MDIVEALACRRVVVFAKEISIFKVVFEGDAQLITRALQEERVEHLLYGHILEDCLSFSSCFVHLLFSMSKD